MNNLVLETIKQRRAIRSYTDQRPTRDQLTALLEGALLSPSARNAQPWHLSVVENQALIFAVEEKAVGYFQAHGPADVAERIASRGNKIFYNAPVVVFISVANLEDLIDVGIVAQTLCLGAASLGLGSVVLGLPKVAFLEDPTELSAQLGFPQGYEFGICVALGYGAMEGSQREPDWQKVTFV